MKSSARILFALRAARDLSARALSEKSRPTRKIIFLFLCVILISCEGPKYFSVTVIDSITKKPIDSVLVYIKPKVGKKNKSAYNIQGYTDSLGRFIREEMVGYGFGMRNWDWHMEYDKRGHLHKEEVNHTQGIIEL